MIVMPDERTVAPDSTAVRTALWRAMHVQIDPPPHVFEDEIGLKLAALDEGLAQPPGHDPAGDAPVPRGHRGPRAVRRGPSHRAGEPWHWPVRPSRPRPPHLGAGK